MSLVNSTIDDYVLASFPLPQSVLSSSSTSNAATSYPPPPPVASVQYPSNPKQDQRLVVTTPGVGVSVFDLADQTPLSSITVGPSFAPTTSAVARSVPLTTSESIRVKSTRQTWVGVRTDEGKGEIWCWQEEERKDGSSEGEAGKAVWPISEPLAALAVPRTLPSHLVFLSSSGSFALAPASDLTSLVSLPYHPDDSPNSAGPAPTSQTLRLLPVSSISPPPFLPTTISALLPAKSQAHIAIIVRTFTSSSASPADGPTSLAEIGKKKFKKTPRPSSSAVIDSLDAAKTIPSTIGTKNEIEFVLLDPEVRGADAMETKQGVISLGRLEVEADKVVVSDDGFVTALTSDGVLSSSRLSVKASPFESYSELFFPSTIDDESKPSLSVAPVKTVNLSQSTLIPSQAILLALHSSFVLLAAPRASTNSNSGSTVSLTYWDARFGAVIASSDLSVPSAVAASPSSLVLSACLPTRNTATITLSPATASSSSSSSPRIALFCLPLSPPLPSSSVLAAIVGRQRLTAQYLASNAETTGSTSSSSSTIISQARRGEPILSESLSKEDRQFAEESRQARFELLERLEKVLEPLKGEGSGAGLKGKAVEEMETSVEEAEKVWSSFLDKQRKRSQQVERPKVVKRRKEAAEVEVEKIRVRWSEGSLGDESYGGRWKRIKRSAEKAIVDAGASIELGTGDQKWKAAMKGEVKGIDAGERKAYIDARNKVESEIERLRTTAESTDDAKLEPSFPSAFVTALLRLSFPTPIDSPSTDLALASAPSSAPSSYRHPTSIISYLLERDLVGETSIDGGVTRYLARAGDWPNVLLALAHVPDVPESTAVSLLLNVVRSQEKPSSDSMDVDASSSLPRPVPTLPVFLAAFLEQSFTPSTLRQAFQKQVSALEALPVLEVCDKWLGWWLKNGAAASSTASPKKSTTSSTEGETKLLIVDPFQQSRSGSDVPPSPDQIVPLVQAILDAHFVTLLLQSQSHKLLRRLTTRVSTHTAQLTDLSTLLGALSVFSRKQVELVRVEEEAQRKAEAKRNGVVEAKKYGESMERRAKAQEKHQEVGDYQVEEFFL